LTGDSLAVAIEAMSWIAYAGVGERTALFKAAGQLGVGRSSELRQAHKLVMETARYQNRLENLIQASTAGKESQRIPHGVASFLKILAYLRHVENATAKALEQNVRWGRQVLGWKELLPYEKQIAAITSGTLKVRNSELTEFERLALQTCNPIWFVEKTIRVFGRPFALQILNRNLSQLPAYIRLNMLKIHDPNRADIIANQVQGSRMHGVQSALKMDRAPSASARSDSFRSGEIVMQDLASIVAGLVVSPKRGSIVLDVCAAPGNKTSHLADIMDNTGEICSIDLSEKRLVHWKTEMDRTGVTVACPIRGEARSLPIRKDFDVVLVDPPCSNTGVFARNPSLKWRTSAASIREHALRQHWILRSAASKLIPNGTLVYCTCSLLPEENELVIEDFLKREQDFRLVPQTPFVGSPGLRGLDLCQRFYPHVHDCNGYFIAKLQRTG
jgi:16S rRNA (cytosine(967)-C(5))-methyltransferase